MSAPVVRVKRLANGGDVPLPAYETSGAAGADIRAALPQPLQLLPGERASVPTGLAFEIPEGFEVQVRPRSGLAARHGLTVLNAPGTVDCDYRGEVQVLLVNHGAEPVTIRNGERIAQIVVAPVVQAVFAPAETLAPSVRGTGGFGSTGR